MKHPKAPKRRPARLLSACAVVAATLLFAAACSSDDNTDTGTTGVGTGGTGASTDNGPGRAADALGDGSLGVVVVPAGEQIQVRAIQLFDDEVTPSRQASRVAVTQAHEDFGSIRGFDVNLGDTLSDPCAPDAGESLAQEIIDDTRIVGVIGPTCGASAVAISPILSDAGLTLVSGTATPPSLTSDGFGSAGADYAPGFFRTSHNDASLAEAVAVFLADERGFRRIGSAYTTNAYSAGLGTSFDSATRNLLLIDLDTNVIVVRDRDFYDELAQLGPAAHEALFLAVFPLSDQVSSREVAAVPGFEDALVILDGTGGKDVINESTRGMYFAIPDPRVGANINQSTSLSGQEFIDRYTSQTGGAPLSSFWPHFYDATTMMYEAIRAASYVNDGGDLVIDRQGIRQWFENQNDYRGLSGTLSCQTFGDCALQQTVIVYNDPAIEPVLTPDDDRSLVGPVRENIVYVYDPTAGPIN